MCACAHKARPPRVGDARRALMVYPRLATLKVTTTDRVCESELDHSRPASAGFVFCAAGLGGSCLHFEISDSDLSAKAPDRGVYRGKKARSACVHADEGRIAAHRQPTFRRLAQNPRARRKGIHGPGLLNGDVQRISHGPSVPRCLTIVAAKRPKHGVLLRGTWPFSEHNARRPPFPSGVPFDTPATQRKSRKTSTSFGLIYTRLVHRIWSIETRWPP